MISLVLNETSTTTALQKTAGAIVSSSLRVTAAGETVYCEVEGKKYESVRGAGQIDGVDIIALPGDEDYPMTWQNLSPSVASFDEEALQSTRLDDGLSVLVATRGTISQRVSANMTNGSISIPVFTGFATSSRAEALAADIYAMLDAEKGINLYSVFDHLTGTYTRNTNCWTHGGPDFSGSPIATKLKSSSWSHENRGALITPQHCVGVTHWNMSWPTPGKGYTIGGKLLFQGRSGTLYERTIVGVVLTITDVALCTLDEPLPEADVKVYDIVDDWFLLATETITNNAGAPLGAHHVGGLAIDINQGLNAVVRALSIQTDPFYSSYNMPKAAILYPPDSSGIKQSFWPTGIPTQFSGQQLASGDSGSPTFLYLGGETMLLGPNGDFLAIKQNGTHVYGDLIQFADDQAVAAGRLAQATGEAFRFATDPTL